MERRFLVELGLGKALVDKILDANSADIGKQKAAAAKLAELNEKLLQSNNKAAELKSLQAKLTSLEQQLSAEREKWQRREYEQRRSEFFSKTEFSDEYAKRGIMAEFDEKEFVYNVQYNSFTGAKEWLDGIRMCSPASFKSSAKAPVAVRPANACIQELSLGTV